MQDNCKIKISDIAEKIEGVDSRGYINKQVFIDFLYNYPKSGLHLEVTSYAASSLFSEISITKGEDTFYFGDNNEKASKPHLWYVYSDSNSICGEQIKAFKSPVSAYKHACKIYKKALLRELGLLESISDVN